MSARYLAVALLFSLPPLTAEVLSGYSGHATPLGVLTGVLIAGPLYGTVAVLIREVGVRAGLGWASILLLCGAFGLVQAGLIDQSLLEQAHFADSPYWTGLATEVPGLGIDVSQVLVFVGGHLMVTFAAPIALVEGLFPSLSGQPWLGRPGLALMGLLYLAAAALFCYELAVAPGLVGSPAELIGVSAVVAALVVTAFALPRRADRWHFAGESSARAPHPVWVALVSLLAIGAHTILRGPEPVLGPLAWAWVAASLAVLIPLGYLLYRWSRLVGWGRAQILAVALAPLTCTALLAFAVPPVGTGDWSAKLLSNTVVLMALLATFGWAWARSERRRSPAGTIPRAV
ncbi:hypothetical protein IU469_03130 [Nocardia puris]|uniref:Uncharacterized protein n=2 Tax=Nocardia puris TaxID=208602 RepID=A0A366DSX8_9NOCA|nr:hypothetical protein [Nocardia puris]MBF6364718.1 hypothetical protein [Nocardia puris]RBO92364.1 hypothetical protein DFR74_1036 [Nocardia puris]